MKIFKCHKEVKANPMNRLDYNEYRGWELPEDENGDDEGYLVEYVDGGKPNDSRHEGYISWSPKEQFDNGYSEVTSTVDLVVQKLNAELSDLGVLELELKNYLTNGKPVHLSNRSWELLNWQYTHMVGYYKVLNARIKELTNPV
jgi:hypothetical protein